jgi:hypothetical protein
MHPYLPFAAIPLAVLVAVYVAPLWSTTESGRYQYSQVAQIDDPSTLMRGRSGPFEEPDIRVEAFLPPLPPPPPLPEPTLVLQSVLTGADMRLATINGQVLREGDRIAGYKVGRIASDGVQLSRAGKLRRLPMRPLHELPPPVKPLEDRALQAANAQRGNTDLTQEFWKIFDSLKP